MRFIALTMLIFCAFLTPAQAATPISVAQANAYFDACKAQPDPRFSAKTQEVFCACTASKYMETLTVEDVVAMGEQNQNGRNATNKMIIQVYAPCMQYPTRDYHYQSCISDGKVKILGNPQKVCGCAADHVANHLKTNGQGLFSNILRTNPNVVDPMQALYDDAQFQAFAKSKLMGCIR